MTRKLTVEHNGATYFGRVATVDSTFLGYEDHGILTAYLHCSWSGGGVGVGGYSLDESTGKAGGYGRRGTAYGLDHLLRLMDIVGVSSWEKIKGQQVVVLFESEHSWGLKAVGIAGLLDDKVLLLQEHAEAWRDAAEVSA